MPFTRAGLLDGSLAGATDLAGGRQARFREALFLGEVVVFDEGGVVLGVQFCEEEVLDEADLGFEGFEGEGLEGGWGWEEGGGGCGEGAAGEGR